ncbi:MAG: GDP-L-fucose synthase family protein [Deltaproteobacteria bacterium]
MSIKKQARIYVAGATGLIGSALVRLLKERGYERVITRTRRELDLTDPAAVRRFFLKERPEYAVMAAGRVGGIKANAAAPVDFLYDNMAMGMNVIRSAHEAGVKKLVYLASPCLYPKYCPQPMKTASILAGPLEPTNEPFALAKIAGLRLCRAYQDQYGARFVAVIPANVYGIGDRMGEDGHVAGALLRRFDEARRSGARTVTVWGSGRPRREFLYADDAASACWFVMERDIKAGIVNAGTGHTTSVRALAALIKEVTGFAGRIVFDRSRPDGNPVRLLDSSAIRSLGWRPRVRLREGIERMYQWYKNRR